MLALTCGGFVVEAQGIVLLSTSPGSFSSSTKVGVGLPVSPREEWEAAAVDPLAVAGAGVKSSLFSVKVKVFLPLVITSRVVVIVEVTQSDSLLTDPENVDLDKGIDLYDRFELA